MKILRTGTLLLAGLLGTVAHAQDYPRAVQANSNITLTIPYLEYEDASGETIAVSVQMVAPDTGTNLYFLLDDFSIEDKEIGQPAMVEGVGACSLTTNAQFRACRADVTDNFFESQAVCFNYSDADVKAECFANVEAERSDSVAQCSAIETGHELVCDALGEDPYDPLIDPNNFVSIEEMAANPNPYLPLVPGNIWVYEGEDEVITITVLNETREIMGVESIVVHDVAEEDGVVIEDTLDWYAQDIDGNVWYMGELSRNYEDGELANIDGSWEAGVEGAKAGILFYAMPVPGTIYRQEYRIGEAEDLGSIEDIMASEATDSGFECVETCLKTLEYTPLEPDAMEAKYYLPGVGNILIIKLGEDTREELVTFTPAN